MTIVIVLLLVVIGWRVYEICKNKVPQGMVLVEQSKIDSLNAYIAVADSLETLAHLPPDTIVIIDTIYLDTVKQVTSDPVPVPDIVDPLLITYTDTLEMEGEVHAWITFKVRSFLVGSLEWGYKPVFKEKETIIEKPIPYPVLEPVDVPVAITGNYLSLTTGGNDKMFIFGLDYDMVREDYIYGLQYKRWGEVNVYGVKVGINLNSVFNKIRHGP